MARIRPSKPAAVFGAVAGLAIVVFVLLKFPKDNGFIWLWAAIGLGILGFNLWAAFAKRGATEVVDEDRPE
ncbi:hypothetical protein FHS29_004023 [Saccharothrix tamanrassetensis]|uniref:Uncharacterized protein n=1 Tax=Saccharothrix tamanrassetensis TaxID=1051531 RepID=A0A841CMR3_9PSEU|nr:hypothetical protein [Saccharothrix tamanrassetensis]MBB5957428.1 hypothetical protein [Saccharothrix tamanrassetensis]